MKFKPLHDRVVIRRIEGEAAETATIPLPGFVETVIGKRASIEGLGEVNWDGPLSRFASHRLSADAAPVTSH
jgi:co-chaperonin GroES (HSP10)